MIRKRGNYRKVGDEVRVDVAIVMVDVVDDVVDFDVGFVVDTGDNMAIVDELTSSGGLMDDAMIDCNVWGWCFLTSTIRPPVKISENDRGIGVDWGTFLFSPSALDKTGFIGECSSRFLEINLFPPSLLAFLTSKKLDFSPIEGSKLSKMVRNFQIFCFFA